MAIIRSGKRFSENRYKSEKEFEDEVSALSKDFFGKNTIFINAKKKLESKFLGGAIPDGFFFDFTDPTDAQFYIVEVELAEHSFYNHVFPQVTKFFAFFKNTKLQKSLVDKLFSIINTDDSLRSEFRSRLGQIEIYKFLSDIVESSQNILLIADGPINELQEIMDTYTDTWGKLVKSLEIKRYSAGDETLYLVTPDFETLQYTEGSEKIAEVGTEYEMPKYSEEYHLEGVNPVVRDIYGRIKGMAADIDNRLVFNPQKYYISIKAGKNIAFMKIRNKKVRFIVMMPESEIGKYVISYPIVTLSQPVQDFYNGPCAAVDIASPQRMNEIHDLIKGLVELHRGH